MDLCAPPASVEAEAPFPPAAIDPAATVAVFHTSGTSGFPKGAALSSNALLGARASTVLAGLFWGRRIWRSIALPWSHIMAVSIALYGLMAGIRGCFLDHFDVERALELDRALWHHRRRRRACDVRAAGQQQSGACAAGERALVALGQRSPASRRCGSACGSIGALLRLPGGRRIPPVLLNGYGMVELGGLAMMGIELSFLPGSGDLCFPVPPFRIRVADEDGRPVRAGVDGRVPDPPPRSCAALLEGQGR